MASTTIATRAIALSSKVGRGSARPTVPEWWASQSLDPPYGGCSMVATDSIFQRALSNMLTEIFDGPPGQEAFVLNSGDPGLLRQIDALDAAAASKRPMPGKTTIAAHADHLLFGLAILNRWAAGEANPWAGADWNA